MRSIILLVTLLCLGPALAGCGIYKLSVRQGNLLDEAAVTQLESGLTRQQVAAIMGTPLVANPFDDERWYYVYYFRDADDEVTQRTVTVYFQGDQVARITDRGDPNAGSAIIVPEQFTREDDDPDLVTPPTPAPPEAPRTPET